MEMPKVVKVGAFDFSIEDWHPRTAANKGRYGECEFLNFVIRIDQSHRRCKVADTLIHEILHAIFWVWGIEDGDKEERLVNTLSTAICTVWRDNPDVIAWINENLADAPNPG